MALAACGARPVARPGGGQSGAIAPDVTLIILPPAVQFEDLSRRALATSTANGGELEDSLLAGARDGSRARGLACDSLAAAPTTAACGKITPYLGALARGVVRSDARAQLELMRSMGPAATVLAHGAILKSGPGGSWDPNSGAITSGMSSVVLNAALIECATGRVLWKNAVLLRGHPSPQDAAFKKSVRLLYATFPEMAAS